MVCLAGVQESVTLLSNFSLVGDSAHLMIPFAGVGFNLAMIDALNLAKGVDWLRWREGKARNRNETIQG